MSLTHPCTQSSLQYRIDSFLKRMNLPENAPLATAISGGADSLCLTLLVSKWAKKNNHPLTALTVDHGLRPESADEAKHVADQMHQLGIHHVILSDKHFHPTTRIEEAARELRYRLLLNYCTDNQIAALFLAHHSADQAETFLLRLARGSGTDGLSAMAPLTTRQSVLLCRPLLTETKVDLIAELKKNHLTYVTDSMNQDEHFERVRWRNKLPILEQWGLPVSKLVLSAQRLNRTRTALEWSVQNLMRTHIFFSPFGYSVLHRPAFDTLPDEYKIRLIQEQIRHLKPHLKKMPLDKIEHLIQHQSGTYTISNCCFVFHKKGIFSAPEKRHTQSIATLTPNQLKTLNQLMYVSTCPVTLTPKTPKVKFPDIPAIIQKSFPFFEQITSNKKNILLVFAVSKAENQPFIMQPHEASAFTSLSDKTMHGVILSLSIRGKLNGQQLLMQAEKELEKITKLDYNKTDTDIVLILSH